VIVIIRNWRFKTICVNNIIVVIKVEDHPLPIFMDRHCFVTVSKIHV